MIHRSAHHPLSLALVCALGVVGMSACENAESRNAPEDQMEQPAVATIPAGTQMTFTLDQAVSSTDYAEGDRFTGTLTADAAGLEGGAVLPSGTKARWVVTHVVEKDDDHDKALLAARLEAVQRGDEWFPVEGTITRTDLQSTPRAETGDTPNELSDVAVGDEARELIDEITGEKDNERAETPRTTSGDSTSVTPTEGDRPILEDRNAAIFAVTSDHGTPRIPAGARLTLRVDERIELRQQF